MARVPVAEKGGGGVRKCTGIKASGDRCQGIAKAGSDFCPAHDPARAEARREAASKAARAKGPGGEIVGIKARIRELAEGVIEGEVERGRASVAFQGLGVLKGFMELELKIKEQQEFEARLSELEALVEQRQQGGPSYRGA
jgi:hypothetical protein